MRLQLDEIPPYTPTPASFQQAMAQGDCESITDRNQLADYCTGGVCGGSTCVSLSTKKEKELKINVSGHGSMAMTTKIVDRGREGGLSMVGGPWDMGKEQ